MVSAEAEQTVPGQDTPTGQARPKRFDSCPTRNMRISGACVWAFMSRALDSGHFSDDGFARVRRAVAQSFPLADRRVPDDT
jgi:hypothetical protein